VERRTVELDRGETAPRRARAALERFDHGLDADRLQDAELLMSELVCNAVRYGDGRIIVHLERADGCFRAEVVDEGSGFIFSRRDPDDLRTPGGWGLPLVDALADRWGAYEGSTHVWFEIALS
jgi:anti-sigma regulatory factor (Ser/Thr protein kinase)